MIIAFGGDGTILHLSKTAAHRDIPVLGVNLGSLGFMAELESKDLLRLRDLCDGKYEIESHMMLDVSVQRDGRVIYSNLALNEALIARGNISRVIRLQIFTEQGKLVDVAGDGVIVASPTGSTAYSLSAGGPVVAPTCACLVISPLAPHNLTMRPVVIPDTAVITLHVHTRRSDAFVTLDNRVYAVGQEATFTVKRAEQKIFLAVPHNISFYDTLRNKMMWGIDIRS